MELTRPTTRRIWNRSGGGKDDLARAAYAIGVEVSSPPGSRSRVLYDAIINQFGVATNKRYRGLDSEGKPIIVIDDGTHVGVIRLGTIDPEKGPAMAEADDWPNHYEYDFNDGHVEDSGTFERIGWEGLSYYYAD